MHLRVWWTLTFVAVIDAPMPTLHHPVGDDPDEPEADDVDEPDDVDESPLPTVGREPVDLDAPADAATRLAALTAEVHRCQLCPPRDVERGQAHARRVAAPDGRLQLLVEILTNTPRLDGAACAEHVDTFDAAAEDRQAARRAVAICAGCQARDPCRAWIASLKPTQRPAGIIAGQRWPRRIRQRTKENS